MLMATSKKAISKKIKSYEKQQQNPTIGQSLKEANEKYNITEIAQDKFLDEGK